MHSVEVFLLVAGAVAVTAVCRRRGWPAPLVLVAAAIVVSVVPGIPRFEIEPEILLDFVLPPLLYSAALSSSYRDFRTSLNSITRLGVGLVLVSALAVALVFWWIGARRPVPGRARAGRSRRAAGRGRRGGRRQALGLPRRVMTLLSGESLINDATSLTLYKVALAGVATGAWAFAEGLTIFALAVGAGVAVGLVIAFVVHMVRLRLDDPVVASAIGLLTPFAAYWSAEALAGSGVLAVVAAGLYLGHTVPAGGLRDPALRGADLVHRRPAARGVHVRAHRHAAPVGGARRHRLRPGAQARDRGVARSSCSSPSWCARSTSSSPHGSTTCACAAATDHPGTRCAARVRRRVVGRDAWRGDPRRRGRHPPRPARVSRSPSARRSSSPRTPWPSARCSSRG